MPRAIFENIITQDYEEVNDFSLCPYTNIRFFEIVYFKKGKGVVKVNSKKVNYKPSTLLFFIPNDKYKVTVEEPTSVLSIKFLKSFFLAPSIHQHSDEIKDWLMQIEFLSNTRQRLGGFSFRSPREQESLSALFKVICNEDSSGQAKNVVIFKNILTSILHIISRNIENTATHSGIRSNSKIQEIIDHLHFQIYEPKALSKKYLSTKFNIAESYFGQYFKKQMGISLKKYVLKYKLVLIEKRLLFTDMTLSEIAAEFGFTDASHLNKTFLSLKGQSVKHFRDNIRS